MRIYWSTKSVPELADLLREERRRILTATRWKPLRHWQYWATFLTWILVLAFGIPALVDSIPRPSLPVRLLVLVLVLGSFGVSLRHISLSLMRPYMRELLEHQRSRAQVDA